jgi:hypothetical protein
MTLKIYVSRLLAIIMFVLGLLIAPGKSSMFDSWISFGKVLVAGGFAFLTYYFWNFYKKD